MYRSASPAAAVFPCSSGVGFRIALFEDCSAFTARYGLHARRSPKVTLYTGGFSSFVTSTTARITTGWSDKLPGGNRTRGRCTPLHGTLLRRRYSCPPFRRQFTGAPPRTIDRAERWVFAWRN